jgi:hypothetical protein
MVTITVTLSEDRLQKLQEVLIMSEKKKNFISDWHNALSQHC